MIMRYDLVFGGVILLATALAAKLVWDLQVLPRLAIGLNLLWAFLVAFHAWPVVHGWVSGLALAWEGLPVDALSFWCAYVLACLPGAAIYRWTVRDAIVDFPGFLDWSSGLIGTAASVWLVPCLLVMTVSLMPSLAREVLPEEGIGGRVVSVMRATPLHLYLGAAESLGGERRDPLLAARIPRTYREQVFPVRSRPRSRRP